MSSVLQEFVMQMGPGGEAGRPNSSDDLTLRYVRAGPDIRRDEAEVRIARADLPGMAELDQSPVGAREPRSRDDPGCGRFDRRSGGRAVVDTLVCPPQLEQGGVAAIREAASDAIGHGGGQER